jgi:hypothetical protein
MWKLIPRANEQGVYFAMHINAVPREQVIDWESTAPIDSLEALCERETLVWVLHGEEV